MTRIRMPKLAPDYLLESPDEYYEYVHVGEYTVEMRKWLRENCSTREWFIAAPARVMSGITTIAMQKDHAVAFKLRFG